MQLRIISHVVVCVKDRTAAGISGHPICRYWWWEPGSSWRLESIKSVCSRWSRAVLALALELVNGICSTAWSGARVKAGWSRCEQNVITVILFEVNFHLVWGRFWSLVVGLYLSKIILLQNSIMGFSSFLFSFFLNCYFQKLSEEYPNLATVQNICL